jgi:hypothetical protein
MYVVSMQRQPIRSGTQLLKFVTSQKPTHAGIDSYNFYIDRSSEDNVKPVIRRQPIAALLLLAATPPESFSGNPQNLVVRRGALTGSVSRGWGRFGVDVQALGPRLQGSSASTATPSP